MSRFCCAAFACLLLLASPAGAAEKFRVGYSSIGLLYLPLFVADRLGLFAAEGLDVETILFAGGGGSSMSAILGGNIDAAVGASNEALVAVSKGAEARMVGAIMSEYASNIVVRADIARKAGITEASPTADRVRVLRGLSIGGGGPGSGSDLAIRVIALKGGLSPETDLTIVNLPGSDKIMAAFRLKRIDGFSWSSPTAETAVAEADGFLLFDNNRGQFEPFHDYLYISVNSSERITKARPEQMRAFLRGIARAQAIMHDGTDRARDAVQPLFAAFKPELYRTAWASVLPAYPRTPVIARAQAQRIAELMRETGQVTADIPLERWFSNDFTPR